MDEQLVVERPGGRRVEARVTGPADGTPLVFHHGTPGAAARFRVMERAGEARGLRLVLLSRPGYGQSDRHRGRRVVDVVDDTAAVLDRLGAERCLVAGWSGGGPHALACAARLEAAAAVLVIAGVAPYVEAANLDWLAGMGEDNITEFSAALAGEEDLTRFVAAAAAELEGADVAGLISSLDSLLPAVDRAVLSDEYGEDVLASFEAALGNGISGWVDDDLAFTQPWGFDLGEIATPVSLWQGSDDLMVPFSHGKWLAARVPGARVHLEAGEGHLSIGLGALDRMLDELVGLGLPGRR